MSPHLYITTATGRLSSEVAPVGGGVAVLEALLPYLAHSLGGQGWSIQVLRPGPSGVSETRE